MNEERGKECSGVSEWYNIPGHSAPVPKCTCCTCPKVHVLHVQLFARAQLSDTPKFARAAICTRVMFGYSRVPLWDIECHKTRAVDIPNQNSGISEHHARANRSTCKSGVSESRARANSCTCNTCTLGQVQSGPVYYTVRRLPNTLFLHLFLLLDHRIIYVE